MVEIGGEGPKNRDGKGGNGAAQLIGADDPGGIKSFLQTVASLSVILGPDWHFYCAGRPFSWRFRDTEKFPVAVDFTDPVSVQMYNLTQADVDEPDDPAIVEKIAAVTLWCERTGTLYGYEQWRRPTHHELLRWPKKMRPSQPRFLRGGRGPMKAPHIRAVVAYLRGAGAIHVRVVSGGKHPRVSYEWQGEKSFYVIACSPRNADEAARNSIRDLRRRLQTP